MSLLLCAGSSVVVVLGFPIVAEHSLKSCGPRPSLLLGVWNLPGPGVEIVSLHWQEDS